MLRTQSQWGGCRENRDNVKIEIKDLLSKCHLFRKKTIFPLLIFKVFLPSAE
jgi:hypothetical protein